MQGGNNVLLMNLTPVMAKKILTDIVVNHSERVFISGHAEEKMIARGITRRQVHCCIKNGSFKDAPYRSTKGNWQMRLEVLSSGDLVNAVVALDHDGDGNYILVVTAYCNNN